MRWFSCIDAVRLGIVPKSVRCCSSCHTEEADGVGRLCEVEVAMGGELTIFEVCCSMAPAVRAYFNEENP